MDQPFGNAAQVTTEWLTWVLRKEGVLDQGPVTSIRHTMLHTTSTSVIARLEISYAQPTPSTAPAHLLLKMSRPDLDAAHAARGQNEVAFYGLVPGAMPNPAVPRCYHAQVAPDTRSFHLLLEDLSATHFQTTWPLPPEEPHCIHAVTCLAHFHAFWWEHPRLGQDIGTLPTRGAFERYVADTAHRFEQFARFLGDRLSPARRKLYEEVLAALPGLWDRQNRGKEPATPLTLVHGDAHAWNFLYPRGAADDRARLIDWQSWHIDRGTTDLTTLIALQWYPERRHALERDLVRHYHDTLLGAGVRAYDWDVCWDDYRISVVLNLFIPVWQWSAREWPAVWWPNLERAVLAFHDLRCAELLEIPCVS